MREIYKGTSLSSLDTSVLAKRSSIFKNSIKCNQMNETGETTKLNIEITPELMIRLLIMTERKLKFWVSALS